MLSDQEINEILKGFYRLRKDLLSRESYYLILLQFIEPDTIKTVDDVIEVIKGVSMVSDKPITSFGCVTYQVSLDGENVMLEYVDDDVDSSD